MVENSAEYWFYNGQKKELGIENSKLISREDMKKVLQDNKKDKDKKASY